MNIGYVRVSTIEQNEARQIEAMEKDGVEKIYMDKQSGKDFNRENYQKMISELKQGDLLIIHSIDRLGRDYEEIIEQWRVITKEVKADIMVQDMPLLNTQVSKNLEGTFVADLVLQILSYVAEKERENIRRRQREGIEIAKREGKYKGRAKKEVDRELFDDLLSQYVSGKLNKIRFAAMLNVSRPTLNRILKEYGED